MAPQLSSDGECWGSSPTFTLSPRPFICHEVMGPDVMIFVFRMLRFKLTFSLSRALLLPVHPPPWYFTWQSFILIGAVHSFMVYCYHVIFGFKSTVSTGCFWLVLPTSCSFFHSLDYCSQCFLCYFGSYILTYYYFLDTLVQWFSTREIPLTIREAWQCLETSLDVALMAGGFGEGLVY